jgi:hypothetical protein
LSYITFVFAAIHSLMAGTDSVLPVAQLMYAATTLVVVFLTTHWVAMLLLNKRPHGLVRGTPYTV